MGWFSFNSKASSSTSSNNRVPGQVEQRSHQPLGLAPEQSDISHTLNQISDDQQALTVKEENAKSIQDFQKAVTEFVNKRPDNMFVIDGEREMKQSIICTNNENGGKTCLKLQYNSVQLFKQMQTLEYFCSLPDDIDATYFECRKIK
ncbi:hypothetical protein PSN45_000462 [Yamadazyma tenuis]|uniref:Uncharacterized protein n=1 Tax=Candida tenuis (strain ATCC 10573 / BCRC 21748 / CBS 615 / JCM 9827 / NBRC 10315 / NRRL Y-1498 / VKM Y-70) TaxID=590646 RepID=G3B8N3_CANTC|nr:uncharacterized protein CANTEDRAFT_115220 [Yamadazyma tenuis ATCC 10573]XP_006688824.1 uncharacterized protein CANTEDRAFT_115220 [Yamadazyma tenuis ATCC 10573]EGV62653.1 hypothetical protein CANTEDRAFT_115220 [Yamadazyma tenuis ATCC 10573]EGV62654.1 hypothetical protein CANTEDRAFT_115220 [Yamadazyma tenuis ATCC 10573]WEJ93003.1 hypothetical protein PSN45_000462 [Yamadazyma tenuis]